MRRGLLNDPWLHQLHLRRLHLQHCRQSSRHLQHSLYFVQPLVVFGDFDGDFKEIRQSGTKLAPTFSEYRPLLSELLHITSSTHVLGNALQPLAGHQLCSHSQGYTCIWYLTRYIVMHGVLILFFCLVCVHDAFFHDSSHDVKV